MVRGCEGGISESGNGIKKVILHNLAFTMKERGNCCRLFEQEKGMI